MVCGHLRKILVTLKAKKDSRKFKKHKKTPAYFKSERTRVKIENIRLDLTISFQYIDVSSLQHMDERKIWYQRSGNLSHRHIRTLK